MLIERINDNLNKLTANFLFFSENFVTLEHMIVTKFQQIWSEWTYV